MGADSIPTVLIKEMGPNTRQVLRNTLSDTFGREDTPEEWKVARLMLMYKDKADR